MKETDIPPDFWSRYPEGPLLGITLISVDERWFKRSDGEVIPMPLSPRLNYHKMGSLSVAEVLPPKPWIQTPCIYSAPLSREAGWYEAPLNSLGSP